VPQLQRLAMRQTQWCKQWPICEPQQALVLGAVQRVKLPRTLLDNPAGLPLFLLRKYLHRPPASPLPAGTSTTAIPPTSSLAPTPPHSLPAHAPRHLRRQPPPSCSRHHRHPRPSWTPSSIRTTKASQTSAGAGPTVVVRASTTRRRRNWQLRLPMAAAAAMAVIWSARSAEKDTLASAPMVVHAAHPSVTRLPEASLPHRLDPHAVVAASIPATKAAQDSIALLRQTPSVLLLTRMATLP
jgi:hypothetical protein